MKELDEHYPEMDRLVEAEERRQETTLTLIASENIQSAAVKAVQGTSLGDKYSEGYPGRRFYQGQEIIDQIEVLAIQSARELFHVPHANVQPYSGSPANFAVLTALVEQQRGTIMGLSLDSGGHLTHGAKPSSTSKYFTSDQYGVTRDGWIDYDQLEELARVKQPKIIIAGTTAYARVLDWERFAQIAEHNNAILMADISHVAGLIVGGAYPSPVEYADIITTTTHKTLRGPRGAIIMVTEKGLKRDPAMGRKIDRAVFPGLQGGPHMNTIAAIAVALNEASRPQFRQYAAQVIANARSLGSVLESNNFKLITGGTDSHLLLVDLQDKNISGKTAAEGLEHAGIVLNYNAIPLDPHPPMDPSGIRIGTPALTSRSMKEPEMEQIAGWITGVVESLAESKVTLGLNRSEENDPKNRQRIIAETAAILDTRRKVENLASAFPIKTSYF